jgi:fumarylacetoacetase
MDFTVLVAESSLSTMHNIPFSVISTGANPQPRCATAIGGYALDLPLYLKHRSSKTEDYLPISWKILYHIFDEVRLIGFH